ncbi:MAG: NADH-quinone oxidoreductase subunit C [Rhodothermales bacterium]|nr:NADH-quinone oxidoreductase subunit C [Rhodothermales bacterium]MBO6779110.1 NADH-quinone oxidoreductase subunit C [Rhodothermales bacterium]
MAKLEFHFTPVDKPSEKEATQNPHAKDTTYNPDVVEALQKEFGEAIGEVFLYANEHTVYVDKTRIVDVCTHLRDTLGFTYLVDLGGVDMFRDEDRYEVFYNLVNIQAGKRLRIKVRVDEESMTVPSVTGVYRAAGWNEREAFDMFGLRFEGHEDLRRMYMPEDFEYHPLRKEFPLLGVPGSLPLPPQTPEAGLTLDPFPAAHGSKPIKSYQEAASEDED